MGSTKTPAMILNEVCAKSSIKPEFQYSGTGLPHDPEFECTCTVSNYKGNNCETKAIAKKKIDARQAACEKMLKECMGFTVSSPEFQTAVVVVDRPRFSIGATSTEPSSNNIPEHDDQSIIDKANDGNKIGDLKEWCLVRSQPDPLFEYDETQDRFGPPHDPTFRVWCTVRRIKKCGISKTKQVSRKIAAVKVLAELEIEPNAGTIEEVIRAISLDDSDINPNELSYAQKKPCEFDLKDEKCFNYFSHSHHDFLRGTPSPGPFLKELICATEKALAPELVFKPIKQIEELLDFRGKRNINEFFESLVDEMKLKLDYIDFTGPNFEDGMSKTNHGPIVESDSSEDEDTYESADEFMYSDDDAFQRSDNKTITSTKNFTKKFITSLKATFIEEIPGQRSPVAVVICSGETMLEAIRAAKLELITTIGVLCK